eukprot:237025-Prorocentrum_minimum.AAC.2
MRSPQIHRICCYDRCAALRSTRFAALVDTRPLDPFGRWVFSHLWKHRDQHRGVLHWLAIELHLELHLRATHTAVNLRAGVVNSRAGVVNSRAGVASIRMTIRMDPRAAHRSG